MLFVAVFLFYLLYMNLITYRAFAADKQFAINKEQRTPEATLLSYARRGGWIGAKLAQRRLRHKSYKQPFGHRLNVIGMVQASCLVTISFVFSVMMLAPTERVQSTAGAAVPTVQPDGALLTISLRPPAGRPSGS
jgi:uncharacterized membrane protein YsdA (DUF1294 family)